MGRYYNFFKEVFKREIKLFSSRYLYIFVVIGLPLFSLIYMATIFGNGQIENVPVGIVDNTNSPLTRQIVREVSAVPQLKVSPEHYYQNERQAREALQKMDIYAYLVIPPDFDSKLYNGLNPTLTYYNQYALLSIGENVNGAFLNVLSQVTASLLAETGQKAGLSEEQITAMLMPTSARNFPLYNPDLDFSVYISYPFFFIFFQIIILVFVVYSIGMELKTGTAEEWVKTAGNNMFIAITGKLALYAGIFIVETIFANYVFFAVVKIPIACSMLPLILSGILLVLATMSLGAVLISIIPQLPIAISFASMLGALGATTCGVTFPVEGMYKVFEYMCYLFPVRYFTHINHNMLYETIGFPYTWPYFAALLAFTIPALALLPRLYKIITVKKPAPLSPYFGIIMIVLGGTVGYGLLYNFLYRPNLIEKVPIALVDNSKSELSAKYARYLDATQGISVLTNSVDFAQAKRMMQSHEIRGIIFLPPDFSKRVNNGEESVFLMYETTTSFLYYLTIQESALATMQKINDEYRADIISRFPTTAKLQLSQAPSLSISEIPLYNHNAGYGSFLLPVVFVIVIFQTLLMGQGVLSGIRNEEKEKKKQAPALAGGGNIPPDATAYAPLHTPDQNAGNRKKSVTAALKEMATLSAPFVAAYFALSFFLLGLIPGLFNLPNIGNPLLIYPFILLFILATSALGLVVSPLFRDSESCILMIPFFSIGLIFLSGMSFPLEQTPLFWRGFYYLFPSSPAVTGYVKLNSMDAGFGAILPEIITLLVQLVLYIYIAIRIFRKNN